MPLALLSVRGDVHAYAMAWALRRVGVQAAVVVLNEPCIAPARLSASPDISFLSTQFSDGCAVFIRRPASRCAILNADEADWHDLANAEVTFNAFLDDLECTLPLHHRCLNDPVRARPAGKKLRQMTAAQQVGFEVPATLISADLEAIREFTDRRDEATIFKPFRHNVWRIGPGEYASSRTRSFDRGALEASAASQPIPGIFQERVNKQVEFRVAVFGDRVVSVSQQGAAAEVDWRAASKHGAPIKAIDLPIQTQNRVRQLCRLLGVDMCTLDLVRDDTGKVWFLDLNPYGQFLYLEEAEPSIALLREATVFLADWSGDEWDDARLCEVSFAAFVSDGFDAVREECEAADGMLPSYYRKAHPFRS